MKTGFLLDFLCFGFLFCLGLVFFKSCFLSNCALGSVKELEGELRLDCHNCSFLSLKHPSASTTI